MSCDACSGLCLQCPGQGLGRRNPAGAPGTPQRPPDPPCRHPPAASGRKCCPAGWQSPSPHSGEEEAQGGKLAEGKGLPGVPCSHPCPVGVVWQNGARRPSTWMTTKRCGSLAMRENSDTNSRNLGRHSESIIQPGTEASSASQAWCSLPSVLACIPGNLWPASPLDKTTLTDSPGPAGSSSSPRLCGLVPEPLGMPCSFSF